VLLGDLPNVYVYAANNPSESIIAKRRGYGTIVSHNVPPYGRCAAYLAHVFQFAAESAGTQKRMHQLPVRAPCQMCITVMAGSHGRVEHVRGLHAWSRLCKLQLMADPAW
jgi:hypothetical protein